MKKLTLGEDPMDEHFQAPRDAAAALYFLPGQYLFKVLGDGTNTLKALSSGQVARAFREIRSDTGWLDRRILRYRETPDGNAVISYEPGRFRTIAISRDDGVTERVTIPLPTLILLGSGKDYHLWAAMGKRVTESTQLSVAPLPNIGAGIRGRVCFGNNEVPEVRPDTLDAVWRLIFDAPFNRDQAGGKCRSEPEDVRNLLFRLAADRPRSFPTHQLIVSTATVEDAWKQIVERRHVNDRP